MGESIHICITEDSCPIQASQTDVEFSDQDPALQLVHQSKQNEIPSNASLFVVLFHTGDGFVPTFPLVSHELPAWLQDLGWDGW